MKTSLTSNDHSKTSLRISNLDYLRGIAATCIMLYHYGSDLYGEFSVDSFMGRIGIYGVAIFYILSGLTLYHVYANRLRLNRQGLGMFGVKRIFRIFPLLWLVTISAIILSHQVPDFKTLALNLTGLFGFVSWNQYFSKGLWSIGNELVFYSFFPLFIFAMRRSRFLFAIICLSLFACFLLFAFYWLDSSQNLASQWKIYTNPLNQIFFFLGGFLMGKSFENRQFSSKLLVGIFISALFTFIFYPLQHVSNGEVALVSGFNRLAMSGISLLLVFSLYKLPGHLPQLLHRPLSFLGEACYSIYLLHPLVYSVVLIIVSKLHLAIPTPVLFMICVALSLGCAYLVYIYFEKYFMGLAKRIDARFKVVPAVIEEQSAAQ